MIEFSVVKPLGLVHFRGTGSISYEYLISNIMQVNNDPDFDFTFNTFVDFENAHLTASQDGFLKYQGFFKKLQQFTGKRKWAIFSLDDDTLHNASIAHQLVSDDIQVNVFKQRDAALTFLGLRDQTLQQFSPISEKKN